MYFNLNPLIHLLKKYKFLPIINTVDTAANVINVFSFHLNIYFSYFDGERKYFSLWSPEVPGNTRENRLYILKWNGSDRYFISKYIVYIRLYQNDIPLQEKEF